MKNSIVNQLNDLKKALKSKSTGFYTMDYRNFLDTVGDGDLIILDPPYILGSVGYGGGFTEEDDRYLIDFMENTKNDFIYFNYLMRDGVVKQDLIDLLGRRDLFVEELSHSTSTGQGIKESLPITEVMISNIKGVG